MVLATPMTASRLPFLIGHSNRLYSTYTHVKTMSGVFWPQAAADADIPRSMSATNPRQFAGVNCTVERQRPITMFVAAGAWRVLKHCPLLLLHPRLHQVRA